MTDARTRRGAGRPDAMDAPEQLEHLHARDPVHILDKPALAGQPPRLGRPAAFFILFGSVFYFSALTIEGLLRPDFHAANMLISELALGPWGWIQGVNFIVFGLSILLFALAVALEFGATRPARIGVTLLAFIGICTVASGIFVIDPVPVSGVIIKFAEIHPRAASFHSKFHYVLGTTAFVLAPISCFCFVIADPQSINPAWQAFRRWSLVLGIAMLLGLTLLKVSTLPLETNPLRAWYGLVQRAMVLAFIIWLFKFGLVMLRHSAGNGEADTVPATASSAIS
jgi:hypothetical protein